jgi:hypothetical protein
VELVTAGAATEAGDGPPAGAGVAAGVGVGKGEEAGAGDVEREADAALGAGGLAEAACGIGTEGGCVCH